VLVIFVAFSSNDGERATFSAALRTVHCPDARGCSRLLAHIFGVSAALEKTQAATPATVLTAEGGRACRSTFAATSLRRCRPASNCFSLPGSHH
jgi:hypothetical protein